MNIKRTIKYVKERTVVSRDLDDGKYEISKVCWEPKRSYFGSVQVFLIIQLKPKRKESAMVESKTVIFSREGNIG